MQIGFQGVGYLVGVVMPQSAQVYVNGSEIILQNGSFNISLAPGKYTIIANASGYSPYELNITVHFGSVSYNNIKLNRILNPSSGTNPLLELILVSVGTSGATGLGLMLYWKRRKG